MMSSKSLLWFAAALLCANGLPAAHAQTPKKLHIGAVISISGGASSLGTKEANAVKLLQEQYVSSAADRPYELEITVMDDASDPTRAVNAVRNLIQRDQVDAVVCCTATPASMAVVPVVQEAQVPTISLALATSIIEPADERQYVFKTAITDRLMMEHVVKDMLARGYQRAAFLGLNDSYGDGGWEEFQRAAGNSGLEIVASERFSRDDTSFVPQSLRIKQHRPDAVYVHAIPPSAALMQDALSRVGFKGQVYQSGGSANQAFIDVGKSAVAGTIVPVGPIQTYTQLPGDNPLLPVLDEFVQAYDAQYGKNKADQYAGYSWDAVRMIVAAYEGLDDAQAAAASGSDERRQALRQAIEALQEYKGVSGVFNFTPQDHLGLDDRAIYLTRVEDGRFQLIGE